MSAPEGWPVRTSGRTAPTRTTAMLRRMPVPVSWGARAWNPVPESENRIHGDDVARAYGFRGGLVPGVVVSAYLLHPAAVAWGREWLDRGRAHVVVQSPVYDGETFDVEVEAASDVGYEAVLIDSTGARCATATVSLPTTPPVAPTRRHDPMLPREYERPRASRTAMDALREAGLRALPARWSDAAEITRYLADGSEMAPVFSRSEYANPGFVLGMTNWVLGRNVEMSPWLHLETRSQHYRAIAPGTELVVEARVADLFEKKGHQFVDADVDVYDRSADAAVASVRLRAIYELRPPSAPREPPGRRAR